MTSWVCERVDRQFEAVLESHLALEAEIAARCSRVRAAVPNVAGTRFSMDRRGIDTQNATENAEKFEHGVRRAASHVIDAAAAYRRRCDGSRNVGSDDVSDVREVTALFSVYSCLPCADVAPRRGVGVTDYAGSMTGSSSGARRAT